MLAAVLSLSKHVYKTAKPIDWHVIYRKISKVLLCLIWDHIPHMTLKLFQDMLNGVQPLKTDTEDRL